MSIQPPGEFYAQLVTHKLLLPTGVDGVPGKGKVFEQVMRAFDDLISRTVKDDGAEVMHFPPAINRKVFESSGFLKSFPQLAGSIFSFTGTEAQHRELLERIQEHHAWHDLQTMTDVCLTPSACYPVYPQCTGTLPEGGRLIDIWAYCFRHEPSKDPARMQMFRMREHIRIGDPDTVLKWRNTWMDRGLELLTSLGLPVKSDAASDPFFGRGGRMLAANQKDQKLKFELLCPITSEEKPTAIMSFNYHQDHFSKMFEIKTADGQLAQTACLGFGMERCILAMFATHGFALEKWPANVRKLLFP